MAYILYLADKVYELEKEVARLEKEVAHLVARETNKQREAEKNSNLSNFLATNMEEINQEQFERLKELSDKML